MKKWSLLLGLMLVGMPTLAIAQEDMDHEDMDHDEMAHEKHAMRSAEAREAIEAAVAEWEAAFNAADAEAAASFFHDDGVSMPPGSAAVEGRASIQAWTTEAFAQMGGAQIDFETTDVMAMGGHAVETGTYTMESAEGDHLDHGKYVAVWVETDDGWKVVRDIWNSDMGGGQ